MKDLDDSIDQLPPCMLLLHPVYLMVFRGHQTEANTSTMTRRRHTVRTPLEDNLFTLHHNSLSDYCRLHCCQKLTYRPFRLHSTNKARLNRKFEINPINHESCASGIVRADPVRLGPASHSRNHDSFPQELNRTKVVWLMKRPGMFTYTHKSWWGDL